MALIHAGIGSWGDRSQSGLGFRIADPGSARIKPAFRPLGANDSRWEWACATGGRTPYPPHRTGIASLEPPPVGGNSSVPAANVVSKFANQRAANCRSVNLAICSRNVLADFQPSGGVRECSQAPGKSVPMVQSRRTVLLNETPTPGEASSVVDGPRVFRRVLAGELAEHQARAV